MPDGVCTLGATTGFPVTVQHISYANTTVNPNDLVLQFGLTNKYTFNSATGFIDFYGGTDTFFLGGSQYTLSVIQICSPIITNFEKNTPIAQLIFWGRPSLNSNSKADIAALVIPIYKSTLSFVNLSIKERQSITGLSQLYTSSNSQLYLPTLFPDDTVYRYTTCIELIDGTNIKNRSIAVAYWNTGIPWTTDSYPTNFTNLSPFGIPLSLTGNIPAAGSFNADVDPKTVSKPSRSTNGIVTTPYTTSIHAITNEYINRFTQMSFTTKSQIKTKTSTQDLKCIAIDRSRDIVNGHLVIDPATGKRLDQEINEEDAQNAEFNQEVPSVVYQIGRAHV